MTTDSFANVRRMVEGLGLSFPVVSDEDRRVIPAYDVGDSRTGRARTATILVDGKRRIRWVRIGASSSDHPHPGEILDRLEKMG